MVACFQNHENLHWKMRLDLWRMWRAGRGIYHYSRKLKSRFLDLVVWTWFFYTDSGTYLGLCDLKFNAQMNCNWIAAFNEALNWKQRHCFHFQYRRGNGSCFEFVSTPLTSYLNNEITLQIKMKQVVFLYLDHSKNVYFSFCSCWNKKN